MRSICYWMLQIVTGLQREIGVEQSSSGVTAPCLLIVADDKRQRKCVLHACTLFFFLPFMLMEKGKFMLLLQADCCFLRWGYIGLFAFAICQYEAPYQHKDESGPKSKSWGTRWSILKLRDEIDLWSKVEWRRCLFCLKETKLSKYCNNESATTKRQESKVNVYKKIMWQTWRS